MRILCRILGHKWITSFHADWITHCSRCEKTLQVIVHRFPGPLLPGPLYSRDAVSLVEQQEKSQ